MLTWQTPLKSPSQGQVHRGAAEVDFDLTRGTWAEVAWGAHPLTPLKSPESKSKSTEVAPGGKQVLRGEAEVYSLSSAETQTSKQTQISE